MLKNRPAAFLCLVFSAGMAAGLFFSLTIAAVAAVCTVAVAILIKSKVKAAAVTLLSAAALIIGAVYGYIYSLLAQPDKPDYNTEYGFYAAVCDITIKSNRKVTELEIQDSDCSFDGAHIFMNFYEDGLEAGDMVYATGKLKLANLYDKSNGISYIFEGSLKKRADLQPGGLFFKIIGLRKWLGNTIDSVYSKSAAAFYKGILIGDRSSIDAKLNASFSRSGITHIIAISGQHFSLIIYNAVGFLMLITKRKKPCYLAGVVLTVAYTLFVGASPSIIRAAFMCCVGFGVKLFNEKSDGLINLCIALAVILIFSPYAILNISLQLSFLASLGIIFTTHHLERFYYRRGTSRKLQAVINPLVITVTASIFCTPVYLSRFSYISILSPLTNIAVNLIVSPAMLCGILFVPLALVIRNLNTVPELLYYGIRAVSDLVASVKLACISVYVPYVKLLFVPALVAVVAFATLKLKHGMRVFFGAVAATVVIIFGCMLTQYLSASNNSILYIHDTEKNSFMFYADGKCTVLVDGEGHSAVSNSVFKCGYTYIDAYVISFCTEDSVTRLNSTLPYSPAGTVYVPYSNDEYAESVIKTAKMYGAQVQRYDRRIGIDGMMIHSSDIYGENGRVTTIRHNGQKLIVYENAGGVELNYNQSFDCAVFTRTCEKQTLPFYALPLRAHSAFIHGDENNYMYSELTDLGICNNCLFYKSSLLIRIGKDGIIKE